MYMQLFIRLYYFINSLGRVCPLNILKNYNINVNLYIYQSLNLTVPFSFHIITISKKMFQLFLLATFVLFSNVVRWSEMKKSQIFLKIIHTAGNIKLLIWLLHILHHRLLHILWCHIYVIKFCIHNVIYSYK